MNASQPVTSLRPPRTTVQAQCYTQGLEEEDSEGYLSEDDLPHDARLSDYENDGLSDGVDSPDENDDDEFIPPVAMRTTRIRCNKSASKFDDRKKKRKAGDIKEKKKVKKKKTTVDTASGSGTSALPTEEISFEDFVETQDKRGVRCYKCPLCPKTYSSRRWGQNHIYALHSGKKPEFNCPTCKASFFQRWKLIQHEKRKYCHRKWTEQPRRRTSARTKPDYKFGPKIDFSGFSPAAIVLWLLQFTLPIWIRHTEEDGRVRFSHRIYKEPWKSFTFSAACRWIACYYTRGLLRLRRIRDGHTKNPLFRNEFVASTMSGYQWNQILRSSCFTNRDAERQKGCRGDVNSPLVYDRLWRIADPLDAFICQCQRAFSPGVELAIDEMMTKFMGWFRWIFHIPSKPIKTGIKAFVLCDSKTGFILNFIPAVGKKFKKFEELGATGASVWALLSGEGLSAGVNYLYKGHIIFTDQFYTMLRLIEKLYEALTYYCGTINKMRQMPAEILSNKKSNGDVLKRGDSKFLHYGFMTLTHWKDNNTVLLASTIPHVVDDVVDAVRKVEESPGRWVDQTFNCPTAIHLYNSCMGAVDLADQLIAASHVHIRQTRWYMCLWLRILEMAILNAHILFYLSNPGHKFRTHRREFHMAVIQGLLEIADEYDRKHGRKHEQTLTGAATLTTCIDIVSPLDLRTMRLDSKSRTYLRKIRFDSSLGHWPSSLDRRAWCAVHAADKRNGRQRKIRTGCSDCKVALCLGDCYRAWHTCQHL